MKITDVEVIGLRVPGWDASGFDGSWDTPVIRVTADDGTVGIGECDSVPAVIDVLVNMQPSHSKAWGLKDVLVGQDASDISALWDRMYDLAYHHGRRGAVIHAISGIDIALWDMKGKVEGKPVSELLGGRRRDKVKAYGTVYPLGRSADDARRNLDRGLAMGLRAIKIAADPWWAEDPDEIGELLKLCRRHLGPDIAFIVDAATAWTDVEQVLPLMPMFRELAIDWLEAPLPVDDIAGHAALVGHGTPIGAGDMGLTTRFEYAQMLDQGNVDIVQPDMGMAGGFTEIRRIEQMVKERGKRIVLHGYKTNLLLAANLQFICQHEADEMAEYSTSVSPLRWELTRERFEIDGNGCVTVPDKPGLGVSLDEAALAKFALPKAG
jgi:L-rhamnonate dehydratase